MAFKDYSTAPASNTTIGEDTFVGPNMPRDNVRPAIQQLAADGRDLYDTVIAMGSDGTLPQFIAAGTGAIVRPAQSKMRERVSVLDYGAVGDGVTEDTLAFQRAAAANLGGEVFVPEGTYLVSNIGWLNFAGTRWRGASKYASVLRAKSGTTGAIFSNTASATASSAYCAVQNLYFDLRGENCTAVDLSSINNSVVQDCFFEGANAFSASTTSGSAVISGLSSTARLRAGQAVFGVGIPSLATILSVDSGTQITLSANATATGATTVFMGGGTGVKFAAPLDSAAYNNTVINCAGQYLNIGVEWGRGANINQVINSEWIGCNYGYYVYNGTVRPDTPRIIGGRVEGCNTGLLEGAEGGYYLIRFEGSYRTDIEWTAQSLDAVLAPACYTAASVAVHTNRNLATSPRILSADLGYYDIEASASRPRLISGRRTYAAAGQVPATHSLTDYSVYFQNYALFANQLGAEYSNAAGNNSIQGIYANGSNELVMAGYNRSAGAYAKIKFGDSANPTVAFDPINRTLDQRTTTVASLPAAGTPGRRAYVTDATATTFNSTVAGGGSNKVPVHDNGTNWVIG